MLNATDFFFSLTVKTFLAKPKETSMHLGCSSIGLLLKQLQNASSISAHEFISAGKVLFLDAILCSSLTTNFKTFRSQETFLCY